MLKADAIRHFGVISDLARAAGVSAPAVYSWGDVVPEARAVRLQAATGGVLKYDPTYYAKNDTRRTLAKK